METIGKIRRRHHVGGESISAIARSLNLSRNTVKKYLGILAEPAYRRSTQPKPQLGPFSVLLEQWLALDAALPKARRRTARRLFEGLQAAGYHGAYDSVQRHVKAWKAAASVRGAVTQAFVPLSFAPGEVGQFDWSYEYVVLGGVTQTIKLAHFRLAHSRAMFVVAYPREPGDPGTPSPQVATPAPAPAPDEKVSCECPRSAVEAGLSIKVCTCKP